MTRIGSIGRTTIACITPAGAAVGAAAPNAPNNLAALAAAGVELDTVDENSTEVIVKIENNDDEQVGQMLDELEAQVDNEDNDEFSYELKLSSPMSWAYDTVKIENEEEFEDLSADAGIEPDNNTTEDDDDLLTTAAASSKNQQNVSVGSKRGGSKQMGGGVVKKRTILRQTPQQLLNQQKHLQHLQLQPISQVTPVQIKLPSIPATITTIAPKPMNALSSASGSLTASASASTTQEKNSDFQSSLSEDKRYRILIQNQRMRKESLEHSEDMIYNSDIEKPWVCRNCNRNYKWKNSLKCHLKNECGQPPRYFCSKLCGYATNVHSNLKRHLNTKCKDRAEEDPKGTVTYIVQKSD